MADAASSLVNPTLRLGVTGLSRSGKTVFITALVHNLIHGGRLPLFAPYAAGRIKRAYLQPQPDDDVPRFAYEDHVADLTAGTDRSWPESTRLISQLRLTVEFEPEGFLARRLSGGTLNIDIVDYPGEWLLDLPLLDLSYEEWSSAALRSAGTAPRDRLSKAWLKHLAGMDPAAPEDEAQVRKAAGIFTQYLQACRDDEYALSTLPPGRFLMPGDLDGSPLITFAPLEVSASEKAPPGSMWAMMQRRYESYVTRVVKPFFINHFARLDRQIVLVDTLAALNAGPAAVTDLKTALETIMPCFRPGGSSILNTLLGKRIDKILFAATKADHLHHSSHDRLEAILRLIVDDALARSESAGAEIDVAALASIRATREARITQDGEDLPSIIGVPRKGQSSDGQGFDGKSEMAMFPGDLPEDPAKALEAGQGGDVQFLKLRPPVLEPNGPGQSPSFPNIRLDRALNFLLGDGFS
ncbi:MAG: YcjX family protein [Alphaproteobacteria bacterium]|nr:YcjX family protein [Alphaproteobacteria bacterium]